MNTLRRASSHLATGHSHAHRWASSRSRSKLLVSAKQYSTRIPPRFSLRTAQALFAKKSARPFPPPFHQRPSGSFSDPLSSHHELTDSATGGQHGLLRGSTNGEDAIIRGPRYVGVHDGVGGWNDHPRGHPALWSRLLIHYWSEAVDEAIQTGSEPDTKRCLGTAFEKTKEVTARYVRLQGSTTSSTAVLYTRADDPDVPRLDLLTLGDSKTMVLRPRSQQVVYASQEQCAYFNCPLQLGSDSGPRDFAKANVDTIQIEEQDLVLAVSDGVTDNLWQDEILEIVCAALAENDQHSDEAAVPSSEALRVAARRLMSAARAVSQDPSALTPFMESALRNRNFYTGGKPDDISVVIGQCEAFGQEQVS